MRRLLLSLVALSVHCYGALTCPSGSTPTTVSSGNISAAFATAASFDNACITISGPITFDSPTAGTAGAAGHGIADIILTGTGSLSFSAGSHTVLIGSTGSDPCGSGGSSAAPNATATAHGFFLQGTGALSIASATNGISINSADGTHPWYISETDAGGASNITVNGSHLQNLGMSSTCGPTSFALFSGISVYDNQTGTVAIDLEHNWFDGFYVELLTVGSIANNVTLTVKNNLSTGRTGGGTVFQIGSIGAVVTGGNVEYSPSVSGCMESWAAVVSYTTSGNFGFGTAPSALCGLFFYGSFPANTTIPSFGLYNDPAQAGGLSNVVDMFGSVSGTLVQNVYGENCSQCVVFRLAWPNTAHGQNIVAITNHRNQQGQGTLYASGGAITYNNNLVVYTDVPVLDTENCMDVYPSNGLGTASVDYHQNTCVMLTPAITGFQNGLVVADSAASNMPNVSINRNLVYGASASIFDTSTSAGVDIYVTSGTGGVGVWGNATYSPVAYNGYVTTSTTPYPTNWYDGVHQHPSATYGDVDGIDPHFLDPNRAAAGIANYDSQVLGGPGTVADFATNLGAYLTGWGSTSYNFTKLGADPISSLNAWIKAGFAPRNVAMCPGGVTIGAVPCAATVWTSTQNTLTSGTIIQ